MDAIVFDTEYTAWEGSMARNWAGPGEHRELVQIGAVRLDPQSLVEREAFSILVRPRINPNLSSYFTRLTGITDAALAAEGVSFSAAIHAFAAFRGGLPLFCNGRDDLIFSENARLYGLNWSEDVWRATSLRRWLREAGLDLTGLHSCDLARAAGADFESRDHDALSDSRSIAAAIRALVAKGASNPF